MKGRRKIVILVFPLLAILTLLTIIPMFTTFMRRPTNMVRNYITRITPIGTSIGDVVEVIERREGWDVRRIDFERGFIPGSSARPAQGLNSNVVGEMAVWVHLGTYHAWHTWPPFIEQVVDVFWGFDVDGNLIEVYVRKLGMF